VSAAGALTERARISSSGVDAATEFRVGGRPAFKFQSSKIYFDGQGFGSEFGLGIKANGVIENGANGAALGGISSFTNLGATGGTNGKFGFRVASASTGITPAFLQGSYDQSLWYQGMAISVWVAKSADISGGAGQFESCRFTSDGDLRIMRSQNGVVLIDRTTATKYRLFVNNGVLGIEAA
jgi:hypothetical protein